MRGKEGGGGEGAEEEADKEGEEDDALRQGRSREVVTLVVILG